MSDIKNEELLKKIIQKIAQYLSRRSHSEKELTNKLRAHFSIELIEYGIAQAKEKKWMEDPYELACKVTENLNNKNKSKLYIKQYLNNKGLPIPEFDKTTEQKKVKQLLLKKYRDLENLSFEEKLKIKRFLAQRGFDESVIREAVDADFV